MPEKPEVMTVVKALKPKILGKTITKCNIKWNNIIATNIDEFKSNIINQKILDITTRGKFIVVILTDYVLLIHLRMEGKFTFKTPKETFDKHEHVEFILNDTVAWRYKDTRKFGKMYLVDKDKYLEVEPLKSLGKEFYDDSLTGSYLYEKIHKKKLPIKTVLLDQSIISGIGNIYDDEILFMSKIKPTRVSSEVTKKECDKIVASTKEVLSAAEKLGGTTIKSFTSEEGVHGLFQNRLLVHQRLGEKCPECGNPIIKIKVNGRGTYYCSKCQK